jgi:hypothetical protein
MWTRSKEGIASGGGGMACVEIFLQFFVSLPQIFAFRIPGRHANMNR